MVSFMLLSFFPCIRLLRFLCEKLTNTCAGLGGKLILQRCYWMDMCTCGSDNMHCEWYILLGTVRNYIEDFFFVCSFCIVLF